MKHTPAPWNLGTETLIVRSANRENHIADCGISYSLSDNEMKANAVLIAAAPELLEALEAMMKFAESGTYDDDDPLELASVAIAKAKGEKP